MKRKYYNNEYPISLAVTFAAVTDVIAITFQRRVSLYSCHGRQFQTGGILKIWNESNGAGLPNGVKDCILVSSVSVVTGTPTISTVSHSIWLNNTNVFAYIPKGWNVRTVYTNATVIGTYVFDFNYMIN